MANTVNLMFLFVLYILEGGDLDPNGNLFYEKLGEGNGDLGDRKIVISERSRMSPIDE